MLGSLKIWLIILMAFHGTTQAAVLNVDTNGQLTGATGLLVNGQHYDVSFEDGRFVDLFPTGYLPFISTSTQATSFANALLDQVFLDSALGTFDTNPALTNGCTVSCRLWVPYQNYQFNPNNAQIIFAENTSALDSVGQYTAPKTHNTSGNANLAYAVFSVSQVSAVPEPNTAIAFTIGFILMSASLAHQKRVKI